MNHHVKAKHKDEFCLRSLWFHNKFTTVLKIKVRAQDTRWMCPNISEVKVNQVRLCIYDLRLKYSKFKQGQVQLYG